MLPQITELEFKIEETSKDLSSIGKSFQFDFKTGEFVIKDGRLIKIKEIEALKQWIKKVIRTEKFRFKIYEEIEYGVTVEDLIVGHDYPQLFVESEIKRELTESLLRHPMINSLSNWKITKNNPKVTIEFTVNLRNGVTFNEVVTI
jgi:hypothetical protein